MIDKNGNVWTCIVCGKIAADAKTKVRYFVHFACMTLDITFCRQTSNATQKPTSKGFPGRAIFVEKLVGQNLAWRNTRPSITRTKRALWWQSRWPAINIKKITILNILSCSNKWTRASRTTAWSTPWSRSTGMCGFARDAAKPRTTPGQKLTWRGT